MKRTILAALLLATVCAVAAPSDVDQVRVVANGFYGVYGTFHPSDGIPNAKERAKYDPYISAALDKLLTDGDAAETHFAKVMKNMSPPLIEGDLFTSNFEGASSWHVGDCKIAANAARCAVTLTYIDPDKPKEKPFHWTDMLYLVHAGAGWRVDDVGYGGSWDFGNKGRMTDTLRSAIHDGNSATP